MLLKSYNVIAQHNFSVTYSQFMLVRCADYLVRPPFTLHIALTEFIKERLNNCYSHIFPSLRGDFASIAIALS